jgi:hypothetical protein
MNDAPGSEIDVPGALMGLAMMERGLTRMWRERASMTPKQRATVLDAFDGVDALRELFSEPCI